MDEKPLHSASVPTIIRVEDLTRSVDGKRLVDGVTFSVQDGDTVAIMGPSGAGKSSLLRLINRLDEPTSGIVYVDSADYRQIPPKELRRRIGMVMQAPNLFPGTVADNVRFGPSLHGDYLADNDVDALLAQVELPGYAQRAVDSLSGGEAQRVSIARTLANQPAVLLLDEPTSALDETTKQEVESVIFDIIRGRNLTCLLVTHDTMQVRRVANSVIVMDKGKVVRMGTPQEALDDHQVC